MPISEFNLCTANKINTTLAQGGNVESASQIKHVHHTKVLLTFKMLSLSYSSKRGYSRSIHLSVPSPSTEMPFQPARDYISEDKKSGS